jgi:hypothetical protein
MVGKSKEDGAAMREEKHRPNPNRVAAGRANQLKTGPLTTEGRQRQRQAALKNRPWEHATGPRTPEGKARVRLNGKKRQRDVLSVREARAELAQVRGLIRSVEELCARL